MPKPRYILLLTPLLTAALTTEEYIADRAKKDRKGAFKKVLDDVPERDPHPGDEL